LSVEVSAGTHSPFGPTLTGVLHHCIKQSTNNHLLIRYDHVTMLKSNLSGLVNVYFIN